MPGLPVHHSSWSLLKLMSIESVMPSNHLILCHLLLLTPSIFLSIRVFSNESVLRISWPKYWSFSFSISPSNEYSGLISFRVDQLDPLFWATHMPDVASHLILVCKPMRRKCHCDFNVMRVSIGLTDLRGHAGPCERHQPKLSRLLLRFPQRIPNAGKGHLFRQLPRVPRMLLWEQLWDAALHVVTGQHYLTGALQMMPCRNVRFFLGRAQQLSVSFE